MKRVAIWDIVLGLLSLFFLYLEYKRRSFSINSFLFFLGNAIFLLSMGFTAFNKTFEKIKLQSVITCIAGIIYSVITFPKIFYYIDFKAALLAKKILPLFFAFAGYYLIHLFLVLRMQTLNKK